MQFDISGIAGMIVERAALQTVVDERGMKYIRKFSLVRERWGISIGGSSIKICMKISINEQRMGV